MANKPLVTPDCGGVCVHEVVATFYQALELTGRFLIARPLRLIGDQLGEADDVLSDSAGRFRGDSVDVARA